MAQERPPCESTSMSPSSYSCFLILYGVVVGIPVRTSRVDSGMVRFSSHPARLERNINPCHSAMADGVSGCVSSQS